MKTLLITAVCAVCMGVSAAERALIDNRMVVDENRVVRGWKFNEVEGSKPYGDVVAAMHDGHAGVRIASKGQPTTIYHAMALPVNTGETLVVLARVRGRGKARVGFFCYGKGWVWKGSVGSPQAVAATAADDPVEIRERLTVAEGVVSVRPMLSVSSGDEVEFYDIAVERQYGVPAEPNISVFAKFVRQVARERGVSLAAAADMLFALGVRGYDCGPDEGDLEKLAATKLKPINFYYFPDWFDRLAKGTDGYYSDRTTPDECLKLAARYGIPRIMVVPPDFTDGKENEAEFGKIVACMKDFVARAKAAGIVVTVEDFGGTKNCCSHAKYLKRLMAEIPDLRFALDTGNLYYAGRGEDIREALAFAKGRIGHVHLKDQAKNDNRAYVTLGLGAVPNGEIVKAMAAADYEGWYTLENPVGDTYLDTVRQVAVLKMWLREGGAK